MGTAKGVSTRDTEHSLHSAPADKDLGSLSCRTRAAHSSSQGQTMGLEAPHSLQKNAQASRSHLGQATGPHGLLSSAEQLCFANVPPRSSALSLALCLSSQDTLSDRLGAILVTLN